MARETHELASRVPLAIVVLCSIILTMLWGALTFEIHRSEKSAIKQASSDVDNLTIAFRDDVKRTVGAIDQVMLTIIAENEESGDTYHIPTWVENSPLLYGISVQVAMIGPDGIMRASTLDSIDRDNISDRPYFRYHLDPSAPQPYISAPMDERNSRKWAIEISRRITRSDGSFGGVTVVSIDPFYFSRFFEKVDLGEDGVIGLVGRDGIIRARHGRNSGEIGRNVSASALFQQMQRSDNGSALVRSALDGVERVYAFAAVPDYPLLVIAGLAQDDVLMPIRGQRNKAIVVGAILSLVIVTLGWFLARENMRRRERELTVLAEETNQKILLDTALNNMRHALLMFNRDGRAVVISRNYVEMYGLSPDEAKLGCTVRELLEQRAANGTLLGDVDSYIVNNFVADRLIDGTFDLPDGRSIRVMNRFMEGGGWVSIHEDVTEQRRAEAALKKALAEAQLARQEATAAHTRLREAFDVVPEGLALFDAQDRYVMWNKRCAELYERVPSAIQVGTHFEDELRAGLAHGQYPEAAGREEEWLAGRLALHAQDSSSHEQQLPGNRWLRICERRTADGGSVGIRIDISELKQREQSVRMLFDVNPVPMIVIDCDDLKILAVNDTAVAHYGYTREQFLGMTDLDLHPAEDREQHLDAFHAFLSPASAEIEWRLVHRHRKADGSEILVNVHGRRLNYDGRPAMLCSIIDVTERVRAERDRDQNREFLDRIIERIPVLILVKDARTGRYLLVNKAAEEMWGIPRERMIGRTPREVFDKKSAEMIEANDQKLLTLGSNSYIPEHVMETPHGTRTVVSNRIAIRDRDGQIQYILGVVEDVTERKAVEDQLRQSQKMESIGQLTGGIAHDFNNMLTVITGTIDILAGAVKDKPQLAAIVKLISEAADRGSDLTGHLLAFARRQPLQPCETDINALMVQSEKLLRRTLGEEIDIELRLEKAVWPALVDPTQLTTALLNLAVNARDAMPNGGKLTLETSNFVAGESYVDSNRDARPGSYVVIAVRDTGYGIPEAIRQRVFEPFFTTKAVGKGTGLGLSMVYGFIKQSNGYIKLCSEEGQGTTFKLYLPRAVAEVVQAVELPEAALAGGSETILLVEDDPLVRNSLIMQLQGLGYRTLTAANAAEALAIADTGEPFDLLLTDVIMPGGMNGRELAEQMATRRSPLKVLFTSGYAENAIIHHGRVDPGVHLLVKPYRKSHLAGMVRQTLAGTENFPPPDRQVEKAQAI
jgi:PAS domain S-box-containing protein